jgi:uncharacterized phiE125 gp8 family phage protein
MGSWTLQTAPTVEPITLAEVQSHLDIEGSPGPTVTGADWTVATKKLTETGAFTTYTWALGDQIYITSGTGVTTGWYEVAGKTDNDNITLTTALAAGDLANSDIVSGEAAQDTYLNTLITAAREHVEEHLWRALITQTWDLYLTSFKNPIRIPRPPLQSVTHVKYYDTASVQQTLSTDVYELDTASEPGFVRLKYGQSWPTCRGHDDDIVIRFVAGYGDAGSDVPRAIRHAVQLWAAQLFDHQTPVVVGTITARVPDSVNALLAPHRCNDFLADFG